MWVGWQRHISALSLWDVTLQGHEVFSVWIDQSVSRVFLVGRLIRPSPEFSCVLLKHCNISSLKEECWGSSPLPLLARVSRSTASADQKAWHVWRVTSALKKSARPAEKQAWQMVHSATFQVLSWNSRPLAPTFALGSFPDGHVKYIHLVRHPRFHLWNQEPL